MSYFRLFKNNWKKITFASALVAYGVASANSSYNVTNHMRQICEEVANFTEHDKRPSKRILVVVNPVANKKKAEKLFRKYCEPLLHLAGYSVDVVNTRSIGHAKTIVEGLPTLPEAIVVAGGEGTSSEVVTGLLRRNERPCPIVLLPLGQKHASEMKYSSLRPFNTLKYVQSLSDPIMPMIRERLRDQTVIKFDVIDSPESGPENNATETTPRSVYGLHRFSWGLIRDIESVTDKYWYFGVLRRYAAALFNTYSKDLNWKFSTQFVYTPPCPGCKNCALELQRAQKIQSKSYFSKLLPSKKYAEANPNLYVENKNCDSKIEGEVETSQIEIACKDNEDSYDELETKFNNAFTPGLEYVKNIAKITKNHLQPSLTLKSRTIQLIPSANVKDNALYSIDGEEYDVRPIKVSLVPHAIKVYG